ncbi:hypothetical protein SADUNF_Sadunf16G0144700 [Salix dunnii]|uniref:NAC domain-containing protein n=1 Tax=Salix dunnii TaxID=1413687 RepID=A0A835MGJ1_9ROSI|nr:hypothetical protein SADUNF_Sadunf16G0144700 [Salix dunnii]
MFRGPSMELTEESKPNVRAFVVLNSLSKPLKPSPIPPPSANSSPPSPRVAGHDHMIDQDIDDEDDYFNNFPAGYRRCRNGTRASRAAGGGYWKATGADKKIMYNRAIVGYRKALVYYTGKAREGDKTNWVMDEFRVKEAVPSIRYKRNDDMRLDDWVLCRIYKKIKKAVKNREQCSTPGYLRVGPNDHAQVPILSETCMDPAPTLLNSCNSKEIENELEAFNNLSNNLPAVDLRINNPSPYSNSATSGLSTSATIGEPKAPKLPQQLPSEF